MNIIFEGYLSEPPSSISCFRDVTLYASCFLEADVLLECEKDLKDEYYRWLKIHGAYDFIKQIVSVQEKEKGFRVGHKNASLKVDFINAGNISMLLRCFNKFKL